MQICKSGPKVTVLNAKSTDECWNQLRLVFLVLSTLLCVHSSTDEVWDPYRLVSLVQITLFCMHKRTCEVWDP